MTPGTLFLYIVAAGAGLFVVGAMGLGFLMMLGAIRNSGKTNAQQSIEQRRRSS